MVVSQKRVAEASVICTAFDMMKHFNFSEKKRSENCEAWTDQNVLSNLMYFSEVFKIDRPFLHIKKKKSASKKRKKKQPGILK